MLAIPISRDLLRNLQEFFAAPLRYGRWLIAAAMLLLPFTQGRAGESPDASQSAAQRAKATYETQRARWQKDKKDVETAWQFARAAFDWADLAESDEVRARVAEEGIEAAQKAIAQSPNLGPAYYYLGLNFGQLARTKSLGALKVVEEMEHALEGAVAYAPKFDYSGPHRSLGLLYRDAPGWPLSIGNRTKSIRHLKKAVALSPEYPENHIALIEALLKWSNHTAVEAALDKMEKILPDARKKLSGPDWEPAWRDWNSRLTRIKGQLGHSHKALETPRGAN